MRTIVTATHTREDLQYALDAFAEGRARDSGSSDVRTALSAPRAVEMTVMKTSRSDRARALFDTYTRDLSREDLQRLFTHDTLDAYRFFTRGLDEDQFAALPPWKRLPLPLRQIFIAFTLKLLAGAPRALRRALVIALTGIIRLFRGFAAIEVPFGVPFIQVARADAASGPTARSR